MMPATLLLSHFHDGAAPEVTTRDRAFVTSRARFCQHGSHFMPAMKRFPDGPLPSMREERNTRSTG